MQKKRIAPDWFQFRPCATSLRECSGPDKRKVRNKRAYFDGSVPRGRRSTELAMKFAGLDIFCCWYLCQNTLHVNHSVLSQVLSRKILSLRVWATKVFMEAISFTFHLLDRLLSSFNLPTKCPHINFVFQEIALVEANDIKKERKDPIYSTSAKQHECK